MITDALQAWVIHKSWSGDTSARVVFFTAEHGLVHCLYKGGRTPKKQAALQAFTPLWLIMDVRTNAYFVRQLEIAAPGMPYSGQPLFAGLYVNELLYHALKPHDPHPALHGAYTHTLQSLLLAEDRFAIERVLRRFEWTLLTSCGYHMSLTQDPRSGEAIVAHRFYHFMPGEGFVLADEGICGAHIMAIAADNLDDTAVLNVAKRIMRRAIDYALDGKEIRSRGLYHSAH